MAIFLPDHNGGGICINYAIFFAGFDGAAWLIRGFDPNAEPNAAGKKMPSIVQVALIRPLYGSRRPQQLITEFTHEKKPDADGIVMDMSACLCRRWYDIGCR